MHAISQSLAHRGPGASRARSRWQPYASSSTLSSTTSPSLSRSPSGYLHTPSSNVLPPAPTPSSSYISPAPIRLDHTRSAHLSAPSKSLSAHGGPLREHKFKYVAGLVDQAVKSLCDIWQPEDIPLVFRTKSTANGESPSFVDTIPLADQPLFQPALRNTQLPSPLSPSTHPSPPVSTSPIAPTAQIAAASCRSSQVIPIRGFVHEVLRRSRTSTSVLQTALCYLEAVRTKVPEFMSCERERLANPGCGIEADLEARIVLACDVSLMSSINSDGAGHDLSDSEGIETVRVDAFAQEPLTAPPTELLVPMDITEHAVPPATASTKQPAPPLAPLPPMPSPLLCPRRTFLACLILASKFLQDRSYSNKAWAKLAGLPPREIGRCERAVGEALEWRLWVGKLPSTPTGPGANRAVARCHSESTLQPPTCVWQTPTAPAAQYTSRLAAVRSLQSSSGLRRSATMPEIGLEEPQAALGAMYPTATDGWMTSSSMPWAATPFSAEPDMDLSPASYNGLQGGLSSAGSIFAYAPSPPLSTPTLSYSPMSTSSTSSSDDGDRTVQFSGFVDLSDSRTSFSEVPSTRFTGRLPSLRSIFEGTDQTAKLPAINPMATNEPMQLPPLSEAVSNLAMLERTIHIPPLDARAGVSLGVYNSHSNWSVSS